MLWKTIKNNRKQIKKNILKCLEQPILNRSPLNRNRVFVRSLNRLLELILLLKPLIIIIKADGGTHTKNNLDEGDSVILLWTVTYSMFFSLWIT